MKLNLTCHEGGNQGWEDMLSTFWKKKSYTTDFNRAHGLCKRTINFWMACERVLEKVKLLLLSLEVSNQKYHRSQECQRWKPRKDKILCNCWEYERSGVAKASNARWFTNEEESWCLDCLETSLWVTIKEMNGKRWGGSRRQQWEQKLVFKKQLPK